MRSRAAWLFIALLFFLAPGARGQGCSQCRDTVSQTQPEQQESYRTAIAILLGAAVCVASGCVLVIRRFR